MSAQSIVAAIHDTPDYAPEAETTKALEAANAVAEKAIERATPTDTTEGDSGAVFEPDVIEALRLIRQQDRAAFQRLRTRLKRANRDVSVIELDKVIRQSERGDDTQSLADEIVELVRNEAELFHDDERNGYAAFTQNGHLENWPLRSRGFADWVS